MSYDFRLRNACDHRVVQERVFLESDSQRILIPRFVSNSRVFKLYINGELIDPRDEEFGYIVRVRTEIGETIDTGTDTLVHIKDNEYKLREDDILNETLVFRDLLDLNTVYDPSNFEVYTDVDYKTVVRVLPTSTITENSWVHMTYDYAAKFVESSNYEQFEVVFDQAIISDSFVFEVTYTTDTFNCRKCNGLDYLNDLALDTVGNYLTVEGTDKLLQDAYIFTFTRKGSDPFYPRLGTFLLDFIGTRFTESKEVQMQVDVRDTLLLLQKLQRDQAKVQFISDPETFESFQKVKVEQDENDLTRFNIRVRINSRSVDDLEVSSEIRFFRVS